MGSERDQLCEEINTAILWEYDLPALKIKPVSDGYKVETVRGTKFLKEAHATEEELWLAFEAVEHLNRRGFSLAPRFIPTKFGEPMVKVADQVYYLTDWLDGKEYNLGKLSHLANAAGLLCQMQQAAVGFRPSSVPVSRERWGKWPQLFVERLEDLRRCRDIANERMFLTEFDQLFLGLIDGVLGQAEQSLEVMSGQPYREVVAREQAEGGLCHHNFTSRNLIRQKRRFFITGFDGCRLDIRLYDLGRLLLRYLPRYYWDVEVLVHVLQTYAKGYKLSRTERLVLWSYLNFPHRLWRLARRHYLEGTDSEARLTKAIQELIVEQKEYQEFLRQLPDRLEVT
ncbi:MAG: CotS family spore coat protein [Firmicutes bacterium]|nr:CotS family spore coat protein [Bacillota bacterium]